jgi:hypothetical protein
MAKPNTPAPSTITATTSAAPKSATPDPLDPIEAPVPAVEPHAEAEVASDVSKPAAVAAKAAKDAKSPVSIVLTEGLQKKLRLVCHIEGVTISKFVEDAIKQALQGRVKAAIASLADEME